MFFKKDDTFSVRTILLVITGLLLGFLVINQARYFETYVASVGRDRNEDVFRQIQILKTSTKELSEEVKNLERQLEQISGDVQALESINIEIEKNEIIAGEVDVFGPGIKIEIDADLTEIWFIDLTNELFTNGAEAVSVNNIRLTGKTIGFDTLPNDQVMINNVILNRPYIFSAIGDESTIADTLKMAGGILDRMQNAIENFDYTITEKSRIEMKKV